MCVYIKCFLSREQRRSRLSLTAEVLTVWLCSTTAEKVANVVSNTHIGWRIAPPARVHIVFTLLPRHVCDVYMFKTGVTTVCGYCLTGKELKACVYALVCVHKCVCGH